MKQIGMLSLFLWSFSTAGCELKSIYQKFLDRLLLNSDISLVVNAAIQLGANVHTRDENGFTPLMLAVKRSNNDKVKLLLEQNVYSAYDGLKGGENPLKIAIMGGKYEIARELLRRSNVARGINPIDLDCTKRLRDAAIWNDLELVSLLLPTDIWIDCPDENGNTALMLAAHRGNTEMVKLLLKEGANKNLRNKDGKKAIKIAQENVNYGIVKLLK
jgi:ankyrin repeat protein